MKVLIVQEKIPSYRVSLFNGIAEHPAISSLDVAHSERSNVSGTQGKFRVLGCRDRRIGPFIFSDVKRIAKEGQYDVIVLMFNLRWLSLMRLAVCGVKGASIVLWGIGQSSEEGLRKRRFADLVRRLLVKRSDLLLLYSQAVADSYTQKGIDGSKIAVAVNSVGADRSLMDGPLAGREKFVAIGALEPRKGFDELIVAFHQACTALPADVTLQIAGDGSDAPRLRQIASSLNLTSRVVLLGRVSGDDELRSLFTGAVACVSPNQAGLSVLTAMSHGVPFVTHHDAITGGERFLITDGINGCLYDGGPEALSSLLIRLFEDAEFAGRLAGNSHRTYWETSSMDGMITAYVSALLRVASAA